MTCLDLPRVFAGLYLQALALERRQELPMADVAERSSLITDDSTRPLAYGVAAAASALDVSTRTISKLISSGQLRTTRIGRRRIIPASELQRLLATTT
jgi:excisionase family DNA binding protein